LFAAAIPAKAPGMTVVFARLKKTRAGVPKVTTRKATVLLSKGPSAFGQGVADERYDEDGKDAERSRT